MITIVNYGSGNISAIENIYNRLNIPCKIASTPHEIEDAEKLILPGVGAFDETISILDRSGLREILDFKVLSQKVPVLGICVGMQLLGNKSDEGNLKGLGWINGEVKLFDKSLIKDKPKIPHLGWNSINPTRKSSLLDEIDFQQGFYFLHSYYFKPFDSDSILTNTFYGDVFCSAINKENIFGVQFHPEKSHSNGIKLLENFSKINA